MAEFEDKIGHRYVGGRFVFQRPDFNQGQESLVYAVSFNDKRSEVYLYEPGEEDILIAEREGKINSLCCHNGWLFDSGFYPNIYDTINEELIAKRNFWTLAICSHDYKMYDASFDPYESVGSSVIRETKTNEKISERSDIVYSFCSYFNSLYDGGLAGIYETFSNMKIRDRRTRTTEDGIEVIPIKTIVFHNKKLYDGGDYGVIETIGKRVITTRECSSLCTYRTILLDAGSDKSIYATNSNHAILQAQKEIVAMCIIKPELADLIRSHTIREKGKLMLDHISLYGPYSEALLKYLNNINIKKKRTIIRRLNSSGHISPKVIRWLEENEPSLFKYIGSDD